MRVCCRRAMGVRGLMVAGVLGASAVGLTALAVPFVTPALRRVCIPYVPATAQQIAHMRLALARCPAGPVVDLGSGDGRVVSMRVCLQDEIRRAIGQSFDAGMAETIYPV